MSSLKWTPVTVKLGQIKPWTLNPRTSTKAQAERLIQSERELGQVQTIAIGPAEADGKFPLYDGHQRFSAWLTVKGADFEMTALQSNRPLSEDERRKMTILLHTATGGWDWNNLSGWQVGELKDWGLVNQDNVKGWNTDANNVKELLRAEQAEGQDAEPQVDRAAELLEKWKVSPGDMFAIGDHRLICGDCTDAAVVARVMGDDRAEMTFIDPPYNALKSWKKDEAHGETRLDPSKWFENDNMEWDEYWAFIEKLFKGLQGHSVYVCCDYRIYDGIKAAVINAGYELKHCIVWKKNVWGLGKRYRFQHEFIVYACKKDAPFYGGRDQSDVWEIDIHKTTEHNTPKPPELPSVAIKNSSADGAIVFDGCNGSGTTLVACQNLGRKCRAVEISPAYVAVALERMATAFPDLEIKRL